MLKKEPQKVILQETKPFSKIAFGKQIEEAFSEKGWGLYFVLGLVTLILVVVIIKIFPEEDNENKATSGPEKNSEPAKEETESPNNDKEKNPEKSE
jgi:cytoskeletal protein RodZ